MQVCKFYLKIRDNCDSMKPYAELARKKRESMDSVEMWSPYSYVPTFTSALEEPVHPSSSLEAFQAEIWPEPHQLREAIQAFGVDIKSAQPQLREELMQQWATIDRVIEKELSAIVEDAVSDLPLKQFNDLLNRHNSVLQHFSVANMNKIVEGNHTTN